MTSSPRFDPAHDAAIRSVLVDTVREAPGRKPARRTALYASIAAACILALGGGGIAFASLHQAPRGGAPAALQPARSATSLPSSPSVSSAEPTPSSSPTAPGTVEPASTPTPTPLVLPITASTIETPVISTPTQGQVYPTGTKTIVFSGTGSPGTNIYLAIDCVVPGHPDECSSAEEYGQPWQTPIVVGTDGHWSYTAMFPGADPIQHPEMIVSASSALVDADGNTRRDTTGALVRSGSSAQVTFYQH